MQALAGSNLASSAGRDSQGRAIMRYATAGKGAPHHRPDAQRKIVLG
jgi:hypothetical protein